MGHVFGAWIGIIWAEIDYADLQIEVSFYYWQHYFAALICPLVLFFSGRYQPLESTKYPNNFACFFYFTFIMRYCLLFLS